VLDWLDGSSNQLVFRQSTTCQNCRVAQLVTITNLLLLASNAERLMEARSVASKGFGLQLTKLCAAVDLIRLR
jgi:hypothetical protein